MGIKDGIIAPLCESAESCFCGATDNVEILTNHVSEMFETAGLYHECKCDFWSRLCEHTREGEACDYAAEYCCGDYLYYGRDFRYLNSPQCYCDFYKYTQNEFGHTLKPKALHINEEFTNPCDKVDWRSSIEGEKESLELIYNATNGQDWTNNDGWMTKAVGHCQWYGITCDTEGFVTGIDLQDNNLVGNFPVYTHKLDASYPGKVFGNWEYTKYGLAQLHRLETLDLADNELTGTVDYAPLYNLLSLTHFDVSGNLLRGGIDALISPSLKYADFSNNGFTSMRRFQMYKGNFLLYCDVSNNAIEENATDLLANIPPNIEQLIASSNQIYGNLPASLDDLQKLRQFNMASNALSGDLPVFTESILSLQELDVSKQAVGITGSFSRYIWRFQSLKIFSLAGNKLAGTIPSDIGKMTALEVFDLSNNVLRSSLPSELGMLAG